MKWLNKDDGLLDVVGKIVTVAGVIIGTWVYFDTIHPVFEKERDLLEAKNEAETLKRDITAQRALVAANKLEIQRQERRIQTQTRELADLAKRAGLMELEAARLRTQVAAEQSRAQQHETAAVESHLERFRDAIAAEGVNKHILRAFDRNAPPFNARQFSIDFIEKRRSEFASRPDDESKRTQMKALSILERFARERMTDRGDYGDIFGVTVFYLETRLETGGA